MSWAVDDYEDATGRVAVEWYLGADGETGGAGTAVADGGEDDVPDEPGPHNGAGYDSDGGGGGGDDDVGCNGLQPQQLLRPCEDDFAD